MTDTQELMQWLSDNVDKVSQLSGNDLNVVARRSSYDSRWTVGYAWDEPYDGMYFVECMSGSGDSMSDAISAAYEKSLPVVATLDRILQEVERGEPFEVGRMYTLVDVRNSGILFVDVVHIETALEHGNLGHEFECRDTGHRLHFRDARRIFEVVPLELRGGYDY